MERKFDLIERTKKFSISIINLLQQVKITALNRSLIDQLVRSATSIGANYHEADSAQSQNDFIHKLGIANKEARETEYWLDLLSKTNPELKNQIKVLANEARELFLIFTTIIKKTRSKISD